MKIVESSFFFLLFSSKIYVIISEAFFFFGNTFICLRNLNTFNFRVAMGLTGFEMYNIRRRSLFVVLSRFVHAVLPRQWRRQEFGAVAAAACGAFRDCCRRGYSVRPHCHYSVSQNLVTPPYGRFFCIVSRLLKQTFRQFAIKSYGTSVKS